MTIKESRTAVKFQFLFSEDKQKDESAEYMEFAQYLLKSMFPFSVYRMMFVSSDSDDAIHIIQVDKLTYKILCESNVKFLKTA